MISCREQNCGILSSYIDDDEVGIGLSGCRGGRCLSTDINLDGDEHLLQLVDGDNGVCVGGDDRDCDCDISHVSVIGGESCNLRFLDRGDDVCDFFNDDD